jgi:hypothetical protein
MGKCDCPLISVVGAADALLGALADEGDHAETGDVDDAADDAAIDAASLKLADAISQAREAAELVAGRTSSKEPTGWSEPIYQADEIVTGPLQEWHRMFNVIEHHRRRARAWPEDAVRCQIEAVHALAFRAPLSIDALKQMEMVQ